MKKLFAVMLIPFFLTSLSAVSTEKDVDLSNAAKYQLTASVVASQLTLILCHQTLSLLKLARCIKIVI